MVIILITKDGRMAVFQWWQWECGVCLSSGGRQRLTIRMDGLSPKCPAFRGRTRADPASSKDSYLVDPASNICLFQSLSHACLRISELIQWICGWLIKTVWIYSMDVREYYMDTRSNSRANTCKNARGSPKGCIYWILKPNPSGGFVCWFTITDRTASSEAVGRSTFCPISFRW